MAAKGSCPSSTPTTSSPENTSSSDTDGTGTQLKVACSTTTTKLLRKAESMPFPRRSADEVMASKHEAIYVARKPFASMTETIKDTAGGQSVPGNAPSHQLYPNVRISGAARITLGDSHTHYYNHFTVDVHRDLLGGLRAVSTYAPSDTGLRYLKGRASTQVISTLPALHVAYAPHTGVDSPDLRIALMKIANICQFLDAAFAEYFRIAISRLPDIEDELLRIRGEIIARQSPNTSYVGSFGEYCERISSLLGSQIPEEKYQIRETGIRSLPYLQDGLEVPYWNMLADHFVRSNHVNDQFTYDAVLSVVNDKRRELKLRVQQAKQKWTKDLPEEIEQGIHQRIRVLDELLAQTSDKYDSLEEQQVQALQRLPTSEVDPDSPSSNLAKSPPATVAAIQDTTDLEKVSLLSLFFVFIAIAMVPFGVGFAGYWRANPPASAIGSASDPDFFWLISSTLLSIFGNIYAAVPLWKLTRGSSANLVSQIFLWLSIVVGIVAVSIYPFCNKAWSSSLSFFCSFFAIGSVFISTRKTSETATDSAAEDLKTKKNN